MAVIPEFVLDLFLIGILYRRHVRRLEKTGRFRRASRLRREALPPAAGMAGAHRPTAPAATSRSPTSRSTTAGNRSASSKRSPPKCRRCRRGASSRATNRPISASTARSIPTGAASMAASIASRGRPMPFSGCRRGSTSRPSCSPRPMPPQALERELAEPSYQVRTIAIGTNTDPYQPIERRYRIMRRILEVLSAANHPVGIVTKSALVLRDLDISQVDGRARPGQGGAVGHHARPQARPRHGAACEHAGQAAGDARSGWSMPACRPSVMVAPVIPGLTDMEMERILERAAAAGVRQAGYVLLQAAARDRRSLHRMAASELPRPRQARAVADALDPRRQALRREMGRAHDRRRALMPG